MEAEVPRICILLEKGEEKMKVVWNFKKTREYVRNNGWDSFLDLLNEKFPEFEIYSVSMEWFDNKSLCKARGVYGDVLIFWE